MPSQTTTSTTTSSGPQAERPKYYYLFTDVHKTSSSASETRSKPTDLHSPDLWQEPYTIDDADLMFDGTPLNLLHEENRWRVEHHVVYGDQMSRGRSRQSKKRSSPP